MENKVKALTDHLVAAMRKNKKVALLVVAGTAVAVGAYVTDFGEKFLGHAKVSEPVATAEMHETTPQEVVDIPVPVEVAEVVDVPVEPEMVEPPCDDEDTEVKGLDGEVIGCYKPLE